MADNVTAPLAGTAGPVFATDDIGGVNFPRVKVVWGADGSAVDASAAAPLPVVQTGAHSVTLGAALPAGSNVIGGVAQSGAWSVTVGAALPAGTNNIGDVDVLTVPQRAASFLAYDWANGLYVTAGSTSARSAVPTGATALTISVRGEAVFIRLGNSSVDASVGAGSMFLPANAIVTVGVNGNTHIAYIRSGSTDGQISIVGSLA